MQTYRAFLVDKQGKISNAGACSILTTGSDGSPDTVPHHRSLGTGGGEMYRAPACNKRALPMMWFVDVRSGSDANDGKTRESAFAGLQRAKLAAVPGDNVSMAPGVYDLELEKQIRAARAIGLVIGVTGASCPDQVR